ncbi:MAG: hypothetical protein IJF49_08475 [Clostridia bacterium]|nr:hypothetical protein [Clostridia bacterium]
MRGLARNRVPFWYAHADGREEVVDENGNRTGSYRPKWGIIRAARANISPSRGAVGVESFGAYADYDRIICYSPHDGIELRELDAVWIDNARNSPHDYVVTRIARSKNSVLAAIRRVVVSQ